jgi:hypothetical protein
MLYIGVLVFGIFAWCASLAYLVSLYCGWQDEQLHDDDLDVLEDEWWRSIK